MYSNNILNFQESTTILTASTKKVWKPIECTTYIYIYIYIYIYCNGISQCPSKSWEVTIYTVSTALYLALLRGLVACLTIPCLSYCISVAIKPFLYSMNMFIVPFYSSTTWSDCISFKDTTYIYIYIKLFCHSQDRTEQFLSTAPLVWIQRFPSLWLITVQRLKNVVCTAEKGRTGGFILFSRV